MNRDIWARLIIFFSILGAIAAVLVVPEFRRFFGLDGAQTSRQQPESIDQSAQLNNTLLSATEIISKRPGNVIAKIDDREFSTGDLDYEIKHLPPSSQQKLNERSKRIELLKQVIITELIYDMAKGEGLDKDPEVIEATIQAYKSIMVKKLLDREINEKTDFDETDLKRYYNANMNRYIKADSNNLLKQLSFVEARAQVMKDYLQEKQNKKYIDLVEHLMKIKSVRIYENKVP